MARDFDGADDWLRVSQAIVTGPPATFACWFWVDDVTNRYALIGVGDASSAVDYALLRVMGDQAGDNLQFIVQDAGGSAMNSRTSVSVSANTWHHGIGVWESTTQTAVYLDGGNKVSDTNGSAITPAGFDTTNLGTKPVTAGAFDLDGRLAECAIWDVVLNDAEADALGGGASPLLVRPTSLVAYWPVWGFVDPEIDRMGWNALSINGTCAKIDHPPKPIYPSRVQIGVPAAVIASTFVGHMPMMGIGR